MLINVSNRKSEAWRGGKFNFLIPERRNFSVHGEKICTQVQKVAGGKMWENRKAHGWR
jgi:hypothetical protein